MIRIEVSCVGRQQHNRGTQAVRVRTAHMSSSIFILSTAISVVHCFHPSLTSRDTVTGLPSLLREGWSSNGTFFSHWSTHTHTHIHVAATIRYWRWNVFHCVTSSHPSQNVYIVAIYIVTWGRYCIGLAWYACATINNSEHTIVPGVVRAVPTWTVGSCHKFGMLMLTLMLMLMSIVDVLLCCCHSNEYVCVQCCIGGSFFLIACHQRCCCPWPTHTSESVINCEYEGRMRDECEHRFELDLVTGQEIQRRVSFTTRDW